MIAISADESSLIRKRFPDVHIRRTVHKYYVPEDRKVLFFLNGIRKAKRGNVRGKSANKGRR